MTANLITGLGIDEFFTRTDGVGSRALLTDALGSTIALGDNTGIVQTQYTYEPYGVSASRRKVDGAWRDYYDSARICRLAIADSESSPELCTLQLETSRDRNGQGAITAIPVAREPALCR